MLRAMTAVTVQTIEPTPTAVVAAAVTWAEFSQLWGPMLDKVWTFIRGDAPAGLYRQGHNVMLYKDDVPNVEVGVQVSGSFAPAGEVVASALPGRPRRHRDAYWPDRQERRHTSGSTRVEQGERVPAGRTSLGNLRRSGPVDWRFRCRRVLVTGGAMILQFA
jgi:hypothetical protein